MYMHVFILFYNDYCYCFIHPWTLTPLLIVKRVSIIFLLLHTSHFYYSKIAVHYTYTSTKLLSTTRKCQYYCTTLHKIILYQLLLTTCLLLLFTNMYYSTYYSKIFVYQSKPPMYHDFLFLLISYTYSYYYTCFLHNINIAFALQPFIYKSEIYTTQ